MGRPDASVVVPARNEASYIRGCLESLERLETDLTYEIIVVDGASADGTADVAREYDVTVLHGPGTGIATGRNLGAAQAEGDWLAFVDADTTVDPHWLDHLVEYAMAEDLVATSARCRMRGIRARLVSGTINHVFPRLRRPILPGFNLVVDETVFRAVGGFPTVPNEDTALSRCLSRYGRVAYHPAVLVETSSRRV